MMELDDLRRQWQQPETALPPMSSVELDALLAHRSGGLVEKMRRNAYWETAFSACFMLTGPVFWFMVSHPLYRTYALIVVLLGAGMLYYYYRVFGVLNRMRLVEGNVRGHLQRQATGLRALLRFYYHLTLVASPLLTLLNISYFAAQELAGPAPVRWHLMLEMLGVSVVVGVLLQLAAVHITRWFMQRFYGQHLDRLETNLRELGDEPAPTAVR